LSQAIVRSTIQRLGITTNPFDLIRALDDFGFELRQNFAQGLAATPFIPAAATFMPEMRAAPGKPTKPTSSMRAPRESSPRLGSM
jgi:hypothetical protein